MKRILLIAPQPFFLNRGTPLNVREMLVRLVELGYDVHLLCYPHGDRIRIPGVTTHRCFRLPFVNRVPIGPSKRKIIYDVMLSIHAAYLALRYKYFVMHGVEEGAWIAGTFGLLTGTPYVADMDSCMESQLNSHPLGQRAVPAVKLVGRIERFFLRRAAAAVTVCEALTDKVRSAAPAVPVFQIEDFPLDAALTADETVSARLKNEEWYRLGGRRLLYTGNLESYQGIDLLLESFSLLADEPGDVGGPPLLIIAGGPEEAVVRYRALAGTLGISERVCFLGERPIDEMGPLVSLCDALVSPRLVGENTPLKIYTYMASGKPIAATSIRSHTQVLNEHTAFLAPARAEDLAQAFRRALDFSETGQARRQAVADAAMNLVQERYSRKAFRERMRHLYYHLEQRFCGSSSPLPDWAEAMYADERLDLSTVRVPHGHNNDR